MAPAGTLTASFPSGAQSRRARVRSRERGYDRSSGGALFTLLRVVVATRPRRASALACGVCVLTVFLYRAGV